MAKRISHARNVFHERGDYRLRALVDGLAAETIYRRQTSRRAEKEVDAIGRVGCRILNCTEPEYAQALLQVYHCPALLDARVLNAPTLRRAALVQTKDRESEERKLVAVDGLSQAEQRIYWTVSTAESRPIDQIVESTGLNSSEVLATLFELGEERHHPAIAGKAVCQALVVSAGRRSPYARDASEAAPRASEFGRP